MSSVAIRRSHQARPLDAQLIGIGVWMAVGIWALFGEVMGLSGSRAPWVYLIAGLLSLPTVLSRAELASWMRGPVTGFRMVRAAERPILGFLVSWMTLIGWAAAGALMASVFGRFANGLLGTMLPLPGGERWLTAALIIFFTIANVIGYRSGRRIQVFLLGIGGLALTIAAITPIWASEGAVNRPFSAIAVLGVGLCALEVAAELHSIRQPGRLRRMLLLALAGPIVGMPVALLAIHLQAAGDLAGKAGEVTALAMGTLSVGVAWEVITLAGLRQSYAAGDDGCLPDSLCKIHPRYDTPHRLVLLYNAIVLVGALLVPEWLLAAIGALAFLLVSVGVNVSAILLANHPRATHRTLRLPLYPLIPGMGLAISLLLTFALGWQALLIGGAWTLLGLLMYRYYGRPRVAEGQLGITVFEEKSERPASTDYTVLVPVANPETALELMSLGNAFARQRGGRVVTLQVLTIPDQLPLSTGRIQARERLEALERVIEAIPQYDVPVDGMTRLSRGVAQGILDTVAEENIDLLVMGRRSWEEDASASMVDQVFHEAPCDAVAVPGDWPAKTERLLVPVAGGPNEPAAARLAQALAQASDGEVTLLNVLPDPAGAEARAQSHAILEQVTSALPSADRVISRSISAASPLEGILSAAANHDAILLGASAEQDFLEEALFGPLSEQIARQAPCPTLMVRGVARLPVFWARKIWIAIYNAFPSLERQEQLTLYQTLRRAARPTVTYFVLVVLSAIIATLGLLLNSPAVIIGAMLVAPLMMPILGLAIGITFGAAQVLRMAARSLILGTVSAIFVAIVLALISPLSGVTSEVLARTQPTLLDLLVAFASGLAGAYAQSRSEASGALPGVAIAAALMPPVCTVGVGIALGDAGITLGAVLLFAANLIAITSAASLVFLLLGIRPPREADRQQWLRRGLLTSAISLLLISLPLGFIMLRTINHDRFESHTTAVFQEGIAAWGDTTVEEVAVASTRDGIQITATVRAGHPVSEDDLTALDAHLEDVLGRPVQLHLSVIEVSILSSP
jgi:uncharacterized hydrophobic protein (TIGR00271 family)